MRTRLLLAAYPKGPRRAEIEDLLPMAAADGHGRRGVSGAINLLRHGLRARLRRGGSSGVVALALLVSLMAGFLLASAANRLSWETVPDLPAGAAREALGELFAPGLPVQWSEDASGDPFPGVDRVARACRLNGGVAGSAEIADVGGYLAGLTARLEAEGWRIQGTYSTCPTDDKTGTRLNNSRGLLARDADLFLSIEDVYDATSRQSRLDIQVHRTEPPWISVLTFAAGLLGALLGWLIFGWASRRTERRRAATAAAFIPALLGLALLAPALSLGLIFLNVLIGGYSASVPFWAGLVPAHEFGFLAIAAGVALGTALLIAVCCRPGRSPQRATAT